VPALRLWSWNVLADAYVRSAYYPRSEPAVIARGGRTRAIVAALAASEADVACLQEVEPALIEALRAAGGWDVHHASKRGKPDGCAILARGAAAVTDVRPLVYADGAPASGHLALCATVRCGGRRYELATTHLKWDPPATAPADRWAPRQVAELIAALGALDRAVVCGDLNVEPGDPVYRTLCDAGLVDPMAGALVPTANPNGRAKRIDHILCGAAVVARALPAMAIDDTTPLPSRAMPSDHIPIGVELEG
jgi:endonuclease/exonuclease/phosphatase family metal-dependent hydrolase